VGALSPIYITYISLVLGFFLACVSTGCITLANAITAKQLPGA